MRVAVMAALAVLASGGAARAETPLFDAFKAICLDHPRDIEAAAAVAQAMGFTEAGLSRNDPAAGIRIVSLRKTMGDDAVIVGIDDKPDEDDPGVRVYRCGVNVVGSRPEMGVALRDWAGFEPIVTPKGLQAYFYSDTARWTRVPARTEPDALHTTLLYGEMGGVSVLLMLDLRKAP